jgi:hypothetical protein
MACHDKHHYSMAWVPKTTKSPTSKIITTVHGLRQKRELEALNIFTLETGTSGGLTICNVVIVNISTAMLTILTQQQVHDIVNVMQAFRVDTKACKSIATKVFYSRRLASMLNAPIWPGL